MTYMFTMCTGNQLSTVDCSLVTAQPRTHESNETDTEIDVFDEEQESQMFLLSPAELIK